jgi:hypothetical protein
VRRAEQPACPVHLGCSPWQAAKACGEGGGRSQAAAEARSRHWEGAARCFGRHKCAAVVIGPAMQRCTHGQSAWQRLASAGSARAHERASCCSWLSVLIYEPAGARLDRGGPGQGHRLVRLTCGQLSHRWSGQELVVKLPYSSTASKVAYSKVACIFLSCSRRRSNIFCIFWNYYLRKKQRTSSTELKTAPSRTVYNPPCVCGGKPTVRFLSFLG